MAKTVRVPPDAPVRLENRRLLVGGKPIALYSGAVHYWRLDRPKWADILDKVVGMGFNAISTYIPWEVHELARGEFDFGRVNSNNDIDAFLSLCERKGLNLIVRPGPQINSELTWFGYPRRILEDPEMQARSGQGSKAVLTQVPRPIPALSYTSEKFFAETALWYDAICPILAKHVAPKGNLVAVQVDNEMAFFFHINPYACDYSPSSIAAYRAFLEQKYRTIKALNDAYRTRFASFIEVEPPHRFAARKREDIPCYVDWIEYREHYLVESLTRLAAMLRDRGVVGVPLFHNYPHPLGPGGAASGITTPFNLAGLEERLDFVGFDIYSRKELYDHVKTVVSYVVGTSRFPYIPEFIAGVWPWYLRPGGREDEEFVTKAAIMHGIKGFSRYMIVDRNRWLASPVTQSGAIRRDRYDMFRRANEVLLENRFIDLDRQADVLLLANREYDRLEASSVLVSFPGDFLEPILGFSEYPNFMTTSEETFGFKRPIQQAKSAWFSDMYRALTSAGYCFLLGDTSHKLEELARYKVVLTSSYEYMDSSTQAKLLDVARAGTHVVLGPEIPTLDSLMREDRTLEAALAACAPSPVEALGQVVGRTYPIGEGKITHLAETAGADLASLLVQILKEDAPLRVTKNRSEVDVTIHRGADADKAVVFVANPTSEALDVALGFDRRLATARELWEGRDAKVKDGQLRETFPPYTIRIYGCTFE